MVKKLEQFDLPLPFLLRHGQIYWKEKETQGKFFS